MSENSTDKNLWWCLSLLIGIAVAMLISREAPFLRVLFSGLCLNAITACFVANQNLICYDLNYKQKQNNQVHDYHNLHAEIWGAR